ncbi:MAG: SurA N-terminal domain-containing protein [Candidatus Omnitrophota bacterium]
MWSKRTKKTIWIILLIAILPGFVLWGFFDSIKKSPGQSHYAGRIYGRKIPSREYQSALQAVNTAAAMRLGDKLQQMQQYLNLEGQAWQRLLMLEEASRRKIRIPDKEVVRTIRSYSFLQNKKGEFDEKQYRQVLRYVFHVPARAFEEQVRGDIAIEKLFQEVTAGIKVDDTEIKEAYNKANEEISVKYIAALPADIAADFSVPDEEIKAYFTANNLFFKKPLTYNLEYVMLGTDAQENKIQETLQRFIKAADFRDEAKNMGLEAKETGLFAENGPIPGIGWSQELMERLANSSAGKFLPPVKTSTGVFLLKIKEKKEPYIPPLEEIKDEVKKKMVSQKSAQEAKKRIDECLSKIQAAASAKESVSLEQMAKSLSLKSGKTGDFRFGSYIEGIGASDAFYTEAKKLFPGQYSGVIKAASGFYIITPDSFKPVDENKFAQEKKDFARSLLFKKQNEAFDQFMREVEKKSAAKKL